MTENKPQISILLAIYNPNEKWFGELLDSLNNQDYPNIKLYACNDCSPSVSHEKLCEIIKNHINAFPVEILKNEKNLGSNKTFENLTKLADGDYFAYCDQDDIWHENKLSLLADAIKNENANLVCSDMLCIDAEDKVFCDSIQKLRPLNVFRSGNNLTKDLFLSNFATGCAMIIKAQIAKNALPFCPYYYHDHYLALFASLSGKIVSLNDKLISYRIHGDNQTSALAGIKNKSDWGNKKIEKEIQKFEWLKENFPCEDENKEYIENILLWLYARRKVFQGDSLAIKTVKSYPEFIAVNKKIITFECALCKMPAFIFNLGIKAYKLIAK